MGWISKFGVRIKSICCCISLISANFEDSTVTNSETHLIELQYWGNNGILFSSDFGFVINAKTPLEASIFPKSSFTLENIASVGILSTLGFFTFPKERTVIFFCSTQKYKHSPSRYSRPQFQTAIGAKHPYPLHHKISY